MVRYLVTPQSMIDNCFGCQRVITDTQTGNMFTESMENQNYIEYLAWVAEGNTAEEWSAE